MTNQLTLKAQNISKSYPLNKLPLLLIWLGIKKSVDSYCALSNISLDIKSGEMQGVLGDNGAGKSTLLRTLAKIYPSDSGQIYIYGSLCALFELGSFGSRQLTGRNYVKAYLSLFDVPKKIHEEYINNILKFSELEEYFERPIRTYSTGMAARLFYSTATIFEKDIYLIDEVLSVGDEYFKTKSWNRIRERLISGASGILVTHDWSAVLKLCRKSHLLDKGKFILSDKTPHVVTNYLKIPIVQSEDGRVSAQPEYKLNNSDKLYIEFEVELFTDVEAELSVSVDYLKVGSGWEIIFLTDYQPIAKSKGKYKITLSSEYIPLSAGEYIFNIFLSKGSSVFSDIRESIHNLSWTQGNGIKLSIDGKSDDNYAPFEIAWS